METVIFSEKAIIPFTDAIKVWMHGEKYLAIIKKKKKKIPYHYKKKKSQSDVTFV